MEFKEERATLALFEESQKLVSSHEKELNTLGLKPSADLGRYIKASSNGGLALYTARHEGELVGYAIYWISRHPHYDVIIGDQDMVYLKKELRDTGMGAKLILFSEKMLKERGVGVVAQKTKRIKDLRKLYVHLGYELHEEVYTKEI